MKANVVSTQGAGGTTGQILTLTENTQVAGYTFDGSGYFEVGSGTDGSLPFRVDQAGNVTAASFKTGTPGSGSPTMSLLAATAVAGYTLVNGTGTIISWTAPNDGLLHRVMLAGNKDVTSNETGGAIQFAWTAPDGTVPSALTVLAAGSTSGLIKLANVGNGIFFVKANTTVTLSQSSALTGGASVVWAEFWGS